MSNKDSICWRNSRLAFYQHRAKIDFLQWAEFCVWFVAMFQIQNLVSNRVISSKNVCIIFLFFSLLCNCNFNYLLIKSHFQRSSNMGIIRCYIWCTHKLLRQQITRKHVSRRRNGRYCHCPSQEIVLVLLVKQNNNNICHS